MATVLNEVAAMIATEVNRLIRMSASPENLRSVNTRRQTAGDEHVEIGKIVWQLKIILVANRDLIATPFRYRMEQGYAERSIRPIIR
jgi:hypothetical protein